MSDKIRLVENDSEDEHFSVHSNEQEDEGRLDTSSSKILQPPDPQVPLRPTKLPFQIQNLQPRPLLDLFPRHSSFSSPFFVIRPFLDPSSSFVLLSTLPQVGRPSLHLP